MSNAKTSIRESYINKIRLYAPENKVLFLIILGLVQVALYLRILALDNLGLNISNFVSLFLICFVFYIFSILVINRNSKSNLSIRKIFFIIIFFSIIFRIIMILLKPTLSHGAGGEETIYAFPRWLRLGIDGIDPIHFMACLDTSNRRLRFFVGFHF